MLSLSVTMITKWWFSSKKVNVGDVVDLHVMKLSNDTFLTLVGKMVCCQSCMLQNCIII